MLPLARIKPQTVGEHVLRLISCVASAVRCNEQDMKLYSINQAPGWELAWYRWEFDVRWWGVEVIAGVGWQITWTRWWKDWYNGIVWQGRTGHGCAWLVGGNADSLRLSSYKIWILTFAWWAEPGILVLFCIYAMLQKGEEKFRALDVAKDLENGGRGEIHW